MARKVFLLLDNKGNSEKNEAKLPDVLPEPITRIKNSVEITEINGFEPITLVRIKGEYKKGRA